MAGAAPLTIGSLAIDADPAITEAIGTGLRTAGFDVQPVTIPEIDAVIAASLTLLEAEAWATNAALVRTSADKIGEDVRDRLRRGSTITSAQLTAARQEVTRWKATLDDLWRRVELLAAPTLLGFPPLLADAPGMARIRGLTAPVNAAGVPALACLSPRRDRCRRASS